MNNNFVEGKAAKTEFSNDLKSPSNMVVQFNKFSSHSIYNNKGKENMNQSFTEK